jgi:type I restriction enzyme R subunit
MSHFNEAAFEEAVINLFQKDNQYLYEHGSNVHKSKTDVILQGDFKQYLQTKYANESLTITEIQSIMNYVLFHLNVSVYESNKEIMRLIADGFNFKREDKTLPPLYINLIDFENVDTNIFKIVNQLEIKGPDSTRYPDMIIYINGLPLVIFEFKSAVKENATILDAYKQITVRYMREIPDLLRFNAFSVLSDGVNNKFGSAFVTYDDFYP